MKVKKAPSEWRGSCITKNKFVGRNIPFSVLDFWDKNTGICAGAMPYRRDFPATTGIYALHPVTGADLGDDVMNLIMLATIAVVLLFMVMACSWHCPTTGYYG